MKASTPRRWCIRFLFWVFCLFPLTAAAATGNQLSSTNDSDYQTALAAIDAQDYNTALVSLNNALTNNGNNGYVYLARAKLDLLYYLPSTAVSDAATAVSLLRGSDTCDQFLPTDSPLLLVGTNSYNSLYGSSGLTGYSPYSSILNLTSISGLSTTGTTTTGTTTTGTTTGTTGTTASSTSSTTSGSTSSASTSASLFASSSGSQKLPVAEDLTDKDKVKNETMNQYNELLTQMSMYSAYCGGIYLNNLTSLVEGYATLGRGYLLGQNYAQAQRGFAAALELDQDDAKASAGLGLAYLGQGAASAALSQLNLAVAYAPNEPAAYVARGAYWVSVGDYGRANEEYEAALALDGSYLAAYASTGLLRALQGDYKYALEAYDKALSLNANYVLALVGRAAAWSALASASSDTSLASAYTQKAQNDLAQAQKLQTTVTNSANASGYYASSVYGTSVFANTTYSSSGTYGTTTSITAPVIGTFY